MSEYQPNPNGTAAVVAVGALVLIGGWFLLRPKKKPAQSAFSSSDELAQLKAAVEQYCPEQANMNNAGYVELLAEVERVYKTSPAKAVIGFAQEVEQNCPKAYESVRTS